ncbi:MAG: hypothetical protein Q7J73_06340, partial [Dehalococcoidales bacterium]|nr:hypothetical protein [Dehalococcoidales bacterium]
MKRIYLYFLMCFFGLVVPVFGQVQQNVLVTKQARAVQDTTTRTSPGDFVAIATAGYKYVTVGIKTTAINTSATFRFLGKMIKLDSWGSIDAENDSTIVTSNQT